jgi:uncharacterized protein (TIGR02118 family)
MKATVLYGQPTDPAAFERYYAEVHMPLVWKMTGLMRTEFTRVLPNPDGSPAPYYRIAELWWNSPEAMQATLGSPAGQAAVGDLPNFATGGFTIVTSQEVEPLHG